MNLDFPLPPGRPTDFDCPRCGKTKLNRHSTGFSAYAGVMGCPDEECGFREGVMTFLGKSLFPVQKMPEGAVPIYDKEPEP